jgi:hypothetical protein
VVCAGKAGLVLKNELIGINFRIVGYSEVEWVRQTGVGRTSLLPTKGVASEIKMNFAATRKAWL